VFLSGGATQLSFNAGRQSPLMKYRVDMDNHSMASEELTNIIVRAKGRASKRPGTEYVDDANSTSNVRLIPWEHSTDDSYVLEFGFKRPAKTPTRPIRKEPSQYDCGRALLPMKSIIQAEPQTPAPDTHRETNAL